VEKLPVLCKILFGAYKLIAGLLAVGANLGSANSRLVPPETSAAKTLFSHFLLYRINIHFSTVLLLFSAFWKGIACSLIIIIVLMSVYLLFNSRRWRRPTVFVSYQHLLDGVASELEQNLSQQHIKVIKLPFKKDPDHDSLLEDVKSSISRSDLIVCFPGEKASFVEYELAMASMAKKPMILVSTNEYIGRLPNTAKHGYPVINLNCLDEGGWNSFGRFCLYVTGCNLSLINNCICIFNIFTRIICTLSVLFAFAVLVFVKIADENTIARSSVFIEYIMITAITFIFVLVYVAFTATRIIVALKVRTTIKQQRFDLSDAPTLLTYKLKKSDIIDILFKGSFIAEHEKEKLARLALEKTVVRPQEVDSCVTENGSATYLANPNFENPAQLEHFGQECPRDKLERIACIRRAAEQGLAEAQYHLGRLFEKGDGIEQNNTRAAHWYLQAAEQGNALAQNSIAELCYEGHGVEQDYNVALKWYEAAADQGVASAAYNAGYIYFEGLHVKRDRSKGLALFEVSAFSNCTLAKYALGVIYEQGLGVDKDKRKAIRYYKSAAEDGDADAKIKVKRLSTPLWQFWSRRWPMLRFKFWKVA
jgi:hypothetical protein